MKRKIKFQMRWTLFACTALSACKPSTPSQCLSVSSSPLTISEQSNMVQGGYIHFGDKMCSAMFDIIDINAEQIRLKGYSARHCRFENGLNMDKVAVSLFFDRSPTRSAGYIKNIRSEESFVARASGTMNEVAKLNAPLATSFFLDALRIPTQYDPWGGDIFSDTGETGNSPGEAKNSSLTCNNFNQVPPIDDPNDTLTDSCWSFLDLGTFDLVIKKNSLSARNYQFATSQLTLKQKALSGYLAQNPSLNRAYFDQRKQIDGVMGLLRTQKAARLAYLLNFDLCSAPMRNESFCGNQKKMIEIMGQNFIELDENGSRINIFDKIAHSKNSAGLSLIPGLSYAELLAGKRLSLPTTPANFTEAEQLAGAFAGDFTNLLKDKTAVAIILMRKLIAEQSKAVSEEIMSPSLLASTNFSVKNSTASREFQFALFNFENIVADKNKIRLAPDDRSAGNKNIHGISKFGTLRVAFPRDAQVVKFQPTDSGSLLTLSGVVPLMVLNTVDGAGTSGGSAILALPEVSDDENSVASTTIARRGPTQSNPAGGRGGGSRSSTVEIDTTSFSGGATIACK